MHYELLYIIPGKYAENEISPIKSKVVDLVKQTGDITAEISLGKKKLAYQIDHISQGYYELIEFDAESDKVKKLDTDIKLDNQVLRHLVVKKEPSKRPVKVARSRVPEAPELVKEVPVKEKSADDKKKMVDLDKKLDEILEDNML